MNRSTALRFVQTFLVLTLVGAFTMTAGAAGTDATALTASEARATALIGEGRPLEAIEIWEQTIPERLASPEIAGSASTARVLESAAKAHEALERHEQAEPLLRLALGLRERLHGAEHATVSSLQRRLARAIVATRPGDAEADRLLERRARTQADAESLHDLALRRRDDGRLDEALDLLRQAESAAAADPQRRGWRRATIAGDLAALYAELGRPALAEDALRRAVSARRSESGEAHPAVAGSLATLADHLLDQERWNEAETVLRDALALRRAAYGSCGPCSQDVTERLERVYDALGRDIDFCLTDAADSIGAANASATVELERKRGANDTAAAADSKADELATQADVALRRGEFARALELARNALSIREASVGPNSRQLIGPLTRIARIERRLNRVDDELRSLERLVGIAETTEGPHSASLAGSLSRLALAAERAGDKPRAIAIAEREHELRQTLEQALPQAAAAAKLGRMARATGDERRAAAWFLEAADDWERMAGRDARDYVTNRIELARSYIELGLHADAATALGELLERESAREEPRSDLQLRVLDVLEPLRRTQGDEHAADGHAAELARLRAPGRRVGQKR